MGWFDDAVDWFEDNVVDPVTNAVDDAVDWVEDNIVDPVTDVVSDVVDWVEEKIVDPTAEFIEDSIEWVSDTANKVADAAEDIGNKIAQTAKELTQNIEDYATKAWDSMVDVASDAWDWVQQGVETAVDWVVNAAEKVYNFVVDEAIPYIVAAIDAVPAFIKLVGTLLILPVCYLIKEAFGEEEATVIQGIAAHNQRLMEDFNIARLPIERKYIVFSDLHLYVQGDMNFFGNFKNKVMYETILQWYSENDYYLVENGDIEDFWKRGGSAEGLVLTISDTLPWPYFSSLFESSAALSANQEHAFNIFNENAETYATIKQLFHDKGNYTRLIGNHDDVWADDIMKLLIQLVYPEIQVNDYVTLEQQYSGETEIILAHGHQSDIFNTPMCNFVGKAATKFASDVYEVSFSKWNMFTKLRDEWQAEWNHFGFMNELTQLSLAALESFSEYDLYKSLRNTYANNQKQPHLILGHTHNPKYYAGIPNWMYQDEREWSRYSNSGNVGCWEDIIFGVEVDYPVIKVVAWVDEDSAPKKYELESYNYGDTYLKPIR